ncbi:MAG: flagellar biosynthesis protein FlhA [Alphaproteobacteria bacterium]|nr:flagellar biosynthesis protein FlhA [Alphaproteobacteria bacterium]MBQ8346100.1 flagellar biosynthesis protein FlhA [Alphaproteobacteria bacterium]
MANEPVKAGSIPTSADIKQGLFSIGKRSDIALALGIVLMLVILILPLAPWLLDIALALSLTFSVLVLMTSIFIEKPIQFTSFPLVLLITTLFRLALNLSSTRLILANGYRGPEAAGHVIAAFGGFIMSGNFIIGVIVFAILVLVNFMVITKGSGRIAEVAARFALDAMPGKQMAIDADLSSGLIDEPEARKRRDELSQESSFYGAMDGASKFVRGDAIAGLVITAINIIAGILIGVLQQNMPFMKAADTYMRLTVGDGLVSQIPALIVSVAAGIMVSKAGISGGTEKVLFGQLSHYPKALGMTSFLAFMLATLPGTPAAPFLFLSVISGGTAYFLIRQQQQIKLEAERQKIEQPETPPPIVEEPISSVLKMDLVRLELGYSLLSLINDTSNRRLTDQIKALRRALALEMGFVMPSVRIQDNMRLAPNTYVIYIKETEAGRGELRPNKLLVMDPRGEEITLQGEKTKEPTFGLAAMWIDMTAREDAMFRGYTVVDCPTIITTHITELVKANMSELLSYTETQKLLHELDKDQQKLVEELIPKRITIGGVQRVLQNLLTERISIRDLPTILEGISEACSVTQSLMLITEHVRSRLSRQISNAVAGPDGIIPLVTLSGEWEQHFAESLSGQGEEKQLSMPPSQIQKFILRVRQVFEEQASRGESPVLLTSPGIRPYVRSIIERFRPTTVVISQNEIHPRAKIRTVGQV